MGPSKSYVEMTGIDAETSQDIAEVLLLFFWKWESSKWGPKIYNLNPQPCLPEH